jgi:hypothetical protein
MNEPNCPVTLAPQPYKPQTRFEALELDGLRFEAEALRSEMATLRDMLSQWRHSKWTEERHRAGSRSGLRRSEIIFL